uniref:Microtubule-associated protein n=1 Tax=Varanus komodoensis TaxID=61221 RepID=A0A8D2JA45_VARKO
MSLSNQPPTPLSAYSQLCKAKNTDGLPEAFHCMEAQKDFGKPEFEWQRTEGKLNEIGLSVNSGGQLKDGLKNAGFTDEDKLCFFEGKLDKELKAAPKDRRETEGQGRKFPAAPGHLENWSLISEAFPPAEGSPGGLGLAGFPSGQAESARPPARPGQAPPVTDQEKAAGKQGAVVAEGRGQLEQPSPAGPGSGLSTQAKVTEGGTRSPGSSPAPPSGSGCPEAAGRNNGSPAYSVIGVVNSSYVQSGLAPSPAVPRLGPPTTTVELAQDDGKPGYFNSIHEGEEEGFSIEKLGSADEGGFLSRGAHQRKAMRRAMSECSHLSVPQAPNLADKYPEPVAREDLAASPVSPSGSLAQSVSPMTRKPSAPMKRSATVSEEQTSASSPGAPQHNAEPPSRLVKAPPSLPMEEPSARKREERDGSGGAVRRELASPGQFHCRLEQIPEIGGHSKGGTAGEEAAAVAKTEKSHAADEREIEVSAEPSAPSSRQGGRARDGTSLGFPSPGSQADGGEGADLTDCGQGVGRSSPPSRAVPPVPAWGTDVKSPDKRPSPSKPPSAATPRPNAKGSPAAPKPTTALTSLSTSSPRSATASPPKRPSTDLTRPKSAPASTTTTPAPAPTGTAASRPKPKPAGPRASGTASTAAEPKKASTLKAAPKTSPVPKPPRPPTSASAPDLKNVRSKIGSTDNIKHQPGGGKVQIVSKKANYSHVQSKCGSKDNIKHVPGGGNVQILNKKIDLSRVASKCGSKANIKHKPGEGEGWRPPACLDGWGEAAGQLPSEGGCCGDALGPEQQRVSCRGPLPCSNGLASEGKPGQTALSPPRRAPSVDSTHGPLPSP